MIDPATRLAPVLAVTFLGSLSTGVFWNALSFVAKHGYGFGQARNLVLYAVMGAVYTAVAAGTGKFLQSIETRLSPRSLIAAIFVFQALQCALPIVSTHEAAIWVAGICVSASSALLWPVIESYVTSGRESDGMRRAIGIFNLTWMPAVALPLFLMPPILERHAVWTIGAMTLANLLALVPLAWLSERPLAPHPDHATSDDLPHHAALLGSARALLPLSYTLLSALMPILPYRFAEIGADVRSETPATATWMVVRIFVAAAMWRLAFWHRRGSTQLAGGLAMTLGFGGVVLAPTLPWMIASFAAFGVGMGIVYYAALYYAMSAGHAEVDAGGTHEALIGAGYALGPLAGLAGTFLGGPRAIVGVVWGLVAVGAIVALGAYRRQR